MLSNELIAKWKSGNHEIHNDVEYLCSYMNKNFIPNANQRYCEIDVNSPDSVFPAYILKHVLKNDVLFKIDRVQNFPDFVRRFGLASIL